MFDAAGHQASISATHLAAGQGFAIDAAALPVGALDNDWYEVSAGGYFHGKTTRAGQFVKLISGKTNLIVVDKLADPGTSSLEAVTVAHFPTSTRPALPTLGCTSSRRTKQTPTNEPNTYMMARPDVARGPGGHDMTGRTIPVTRTDGSEVASEGHKRRLSRRKRTTWTLRCRHDALRGTGNKTLTDLWDEPNYAGGVGQRHTALASILAALGPLATDKHRTAESGPLTGASSCCRGDFREHAQRR